MRSFVLAVVGVLVLASIFVVPGDGPTAGGRENAVQNDGQLDLREANVVGVSVAREDGSYTFDVALHHDDEGEAGYADWWQVETLEGDRLGRRDLAHPHGTQAFTRSETIEIPATVTRVAVRGHDETHGYGGQAWLVDLEAGDAIAVHQGSEPANFSDAGSIYEG